MVSRGDRTAGGGVALVEEEEKVEEIFLWPF